MFSANARCTPTAGRFARQDDGQQYQGADHQGGSERGAAEHIAEVVSVGAGKAAVQDEAGRVGDADKDQRDDRPDHEVRQQQNKIMQPGLELLQHQREGVGDVAPR